MEPTDALRLSTPRLILRDFVEEDLPAVHALRSDPEVTRFMDDLEPESLDQSRAWLEGAIYHNRKRPREAYNLAIVHAAENRVIGWIGIGRSERYPEPGELGFGYMLGRPDWGRGYATEAVRAILDFGFRALGGRRLSAWCYVENRASARVLEKAGLRLQRRYQHVEPKSGRSVECVEYAVLAGGYDSVSQPWALASTDRPASRCHQSQDLPQSHPAPRPSCGGDLG